MARHVILGFCLLMISNGTMGQNRVIFRDSEKAELTLEYTNGRNRMIDTVIEALAAVVPKKKEFTRVKFTSEIITRIVAPDSLQRIATVELYDATCSGDVFYKGFSLSDVLLPSYCLLSFSIFADNIQPILTRSQLYYYPVEGYNKLASITVKDSGEWVASSLKVNDFTPGYDTAFPGRFFRRTGLIDKYYLTVPRIDSCLSRLRKFDLKNTDLIFVYDIHLREMEKFAEQLYALDLPGKLRLHVNDPAGFIDAFSLLSDTLIIARGEMNRHVEHLDRLYYEKGMSALGAGQYQPAGIYFRKSVLYNALYAPSQIQLARILYMRDSITQAADILMFVSKNTNPDPETYKELILNTDTIFKALVDKGNAFLYMQKFNEARDIFLFCSNFCNSIGGYVCDGSHLRGLAAAKFGIYQSFLSVAQRAIDNGKLELAEVYINEARQYQKANSNEIISDAEAGSMTMILLNSLIKRADTLNARKQYEKALQLLSRAEAICAANQSEAPARLNISIANAKSGHYLSLLYKANKHLGRQEISLAERTLEEAAKLEAENPEIIKHSTLADSVKVKIKIRRYQELIAAGNYLLKEQQYAQALTLFLEADTADGIPSNSRNSSLDSLIRICAFPAIEKMSAGIRSLLLLSGPDSAEYQLQKLINIRKQCRLFADDNISRLISELTLEVENARCARKRAVYDSNYSAAGMAINAKEYDLAGVYLNRAIRISESAPRCSIDASEAISDRRFYLLASGYQEILNQAMGMLSTGNYNEFVYLYRKAEDFGISGLKSFGIVHTPLTDMLATTEKTALLMAAYKMYSAGGRPDESLICLKNLKRLRCDPELLNGMMKQTAIMAAIRDYQINPGLNPSKFVAFYTADAPWLNTFRKSYLAAYRSLAKSKQNKPGGTQPKIE